MMNQNYVGSVKKLALPLGFRFQPTDEELVFQYLKCKVFSSPLHSSSFIPHLNVFNYDPWDLPGELEEDKYFISSKEAKYRSGNRINRLTASGYWKSTGLDKQIVSRRNQMAARGMRKTLVFHMGQGFRTDWIMHEYRLVTLSNKDPRIQKYLDHQMEKWVICHVFLKKSRKSTVSSNNNNDTVTPDLFDFKGEKSGKTYESSSSSYSSSSCSSTITEVSSSGADHGDITEVSSSGADHGDITEVSSSGADHGDITEVSSSGADHGDITEVSSSGADHGDITEVSSSGADITEVSSSGADHGDITEVSSSGADHGYIS